MFNEFIAEGLRIPMPTFCLNDKRYNAKLYGALILMSKRFKYEKHRYVYRNSFDMKELSENINMSIPTIRKYLNSMEDIGVLKRKNTEDGLVFYLYYYNQDYKNKYITIPQTDLKYFVCSHDDNTIKIYCLLKYMCNTKTYRAIENRWVCEQIGLSINSNSNLTTITNIMEQLKMDKYIYTNYENQIKFNTKTKRESNYTIKKYKLTKEKIKLKNSSKNRSN